MSFCLSVCIFHCFLKKDNNLPLGYLGGIILVFQMHKIVFTLVSLPKGAVLGYFCTFIFNVTFLCFSFSWDPLNYFTSIFLQMLLVLLCITKESFSQYLPLCRKPFWGTLRLILGYILVFLKSCSILLYKFCTVVFCITLTFNGLRKIWSIYLSAGGYFAVFFELFWVFPSCLEKHKTLCCHLSALDIYGCFLLHFVICFWNGSQLSNIFWCIFVVLFFSKILSNRNCDNWSWTCWDKHHAYFDTNWFILIFKHAAMSIIGCSDAHY